MSRGDHHFLFTIFCVHFIYCAKIAQQVDVFFWGNVINFLASQMPGEPVRPKELPPPKRSAHLQTWSAAPPTPQPMSPLWRARGERRRPALQAPRRLVRAPNCCPSCGPSQRRSFCPDLRTRRQFRVLVCAFSYIHRPFIAFNETHTSSNLFSVPNVR